MVSVLEHELDTVKRQIRELERTSRQAQSMEGTTLSMFPKLKLHRPPEEIAGDPEVRRTILAYWRGADELRVKLASDVPYARRQEKHGETTSATTSAGRSIPHETHDRKQER